jgi:hypothetical protein
MARQILVPLRGSDRIEQFLPYIEQVAQPGMRVVFLVHFGVSAFKELTDQLLAIHTGIRPAFLPGKSSIDMVENKRRSVDRQFLPACELLRQRGIRISVNVCAGRLQTVVQEYLKKEEVHLVMMRPAGNGLMGYLRKISRIPRFVKPPTVPPVLLLHPSNIAES